MSYYKPGPDPSPQLQEQLGGWTVLGLLALALLVPFIGPLIGIFYGIANTRKGGAWAIIGGGIALLALQILLVAAAPWLAASVIDRNKEVQVKDNLRTIQLGLWKYQLDHDGRYPFDVQVLVSEHYLDEFPKNPFTNQPMQAKAHGAMPEIGDFSYQVVIEDGKPVNFSLLGYGIPKGTNLDASSNKGRVILSLSGGDVCYKPNGKTKAAQP